MTQYLFRLDDICPTMHHAHFEHLVSLFSHYHIRPLLAVVPDNQDPKLMVDTPAAGFWQSITDLANQGWGLAQHGYQHLYHTQNSGLLALRTRSEFAGLSYEEQSQKIKAGQAIVQKKLGRPIAWWSAPAHSFDATTCQVLRENGFTHISDGIALWPYRHEGLTWVPHQTWSPQAKPLGLWTIGLHLNTMSDKQMATLTSFVARHVDACRNVSLEPHATIANELFRPLWYAQYNYVRHYR